MQHQNETPSLTSGSWLSEATTIIFLDFLKTEDSLVSTINYNFCMTIHLKLDCILVPCVLESVLMDSWEPICTHLIPTLSSGTSQWWREIGCGESIYVMEKGKCYKLGLPPPREPVCCSTHHITYMCPRTCREYTTRCFLVIHHLTKVCVKANWLNY